MMGTPEDRFRQRLERWAASYPEDGFFGPESVTWRITRESILFWGGLRALLMQVAHPLVAQGVFDHSAFEQDPIGRGLRTFRAVYRIVYGSKRTAIETAVAVWSIHRRVRGQLAENTPLWPAGTPYRAIDPGLLLWVHATLIDTTVWVYERCVRPLTTPELEAFYQESKRFAHLFGVPERRIPPDWPAFRAYVERMLVGPELFVTMAGRAIAAALIRGGPWYAKAGAPLATILAAGTLPPALRQAYRLPWDPLVRRAYRRLENLAFGGYPLLPPRIRAVPAWRRALARKAVGSRRLAS